MKAKTVIYKRVFGLGNYENESISIELEVEEGEKAQDVLDKAKEFVERQHKKEDLMLTVSKDILNNPDKFTGKRVKEAKEYVEAHKEEEKEDLPF